MSRSTTRRVWALAAAVALTGATGCGYTFGTGLEERGIRTIGVRVVSNQSWRQGLEVPLTEEIIAQLSRTELMVAPAHRADAVLEVVITSDRGRGLVGGGRSDPVREGSLELTAVSRLIDRRTGRTLAERDLMDRVEYRNPIGESLQSVTPELVIDLARKIVLALEPSF